MLDRIGYYCWAGPGTIRMIEVKYFNPRFDTRSLMTSYDYDYIARVRDTFGVTDFWVTYSWGFSDATEQEDREFILRRLENFQKLGVRTHAYIQGPNLVYDEFPDVDWWARDDRGRLITYYRGRRVTSIHHAGYVAYILDKIRSLHGSGFDGIYIDNIQHGQLGAPAQPGKLPFVFCGDNSPAARAHFKAETGYDLPTDLETDPEITRAYLDFRVRSNTAYVRHMADAAHEGGMEFGTNFYDPKFDPEYIYGIDLKAKSEVQDYVLFENHALPSSDGRINNCYIEDIIEQNEIEKPVFVVSYREGVGMSKAFSQEDFDNILSEAAVTSFRVALKGSEFTTNGVWHNLDPTRYDIPRTDKPLKRVRRSSNDDPVQALIRLGMIRRVMKHVYNPLTYVAFEWRAFRFILNVVYNAAIK